MDITQFKATLCSKDVKIYIISHAMSVLELGMKVLKCSSVEHVIENFNIVYDEFQKSSKWNPSSKQTYMIDFKRAIEHFPSLCEKIPTGMLGKPLKKRKRKLIIDTDDEDDVIDVKKVKLIVQEPVVNIFELNVHEKVWKLGFKKQQDDIVISHNNNMKVKIKIIDTEKIQNYLVRILEMMLKEAYNLDAEVKCVLTYNGNTLYECKIVQATKNIRDAANYVWREMIVPFYDITMV